MWSTAKKRSGAGLRLCLPREQDLCTPRRKAIAAEEIAGLKARTSEARTREPFSKRSSRKRDNYLRELTAEGLDRFQEVRSRWVVLNRHHPAGFPFDV
jgi:hypothetical protein